MDAESLKAEIARLRAQANKIARIRQEMVEELRKVEQEYSERANGMFELMSKLEEKK